MADFKKADLRRSRNEGGYANNPHDKGGETWQGVARNYHPEWAGWAIIDQIKPQCKNLKELNAALFKDPQLAQLVEVFYKHGFWDISQLDRFSSQLLAENVYDASVNCGPAMGPRFLQQTLNALKSYGLVVDSVMGNKTFSAMADALVSLGEEKVINAYVDLREAYHRGIVKSNPSQAGFLKTWLARCEWMRKEVG